MLLPAAALLFIVHLQDQPRSDCREWHACRQMAVEAAAAGEYERFHDLAWRAVQTGPRNDPALMLLLARAQSLSGRPGDALVMLQRLAAMGAPTDAATSDDFRRVRNLPGWAEFAGAAAVPSASPGTGKAAETAGLKASTTEKASAGEAAGLKASTTEKASAGEAAGLKASTTEKASTGEAAGLKASTTDKTPGKPSTIGSAAKAPDEAVRFETLPFTPAGLAYDAVSRRFIVGDRRARRLAVVDEFSRHVANLASARSAGFGDIAAVEIDARQGDLWVVSADGARSTLHKLQLISGRALASYAPADRLGDVEFVDVASTADTGVLVLDRAGHRIFHLRPRAAALELALGLPDDRPATIAPAGDNVAYVAHAGGIARVDLSARSVADLKPAKNVDLTNITKMRWHKGSLIAVQGAADGSYRAVRIDLDRPGRRATGSQPLGASLAPIDPTAATIAGGVLYYLARANDVDMTVAKLPLR